jgi:cysteine desulfuration protein SufE
MLEIIEMELIMAEIQDRISRITQRFLQYKDWEDRYKELVVIGRELSNLSDENKQEKFQIKGCQSQVWLVPHFEDNKLFFAGDSDAMLVKGIVGLLINVYSGETPAVILATPPDFLKEIGITEHLSLNRTNGLRAMFKQMQMYAIAFQTLSSSQKKGL